MIERRSFLAAVTAAGLAPALPRAAAVEINRGVSALVLSGGGARGAYQAGIIGALVARNGVADGARLTPYRLVCGSSIGALNGWFVATGAYSKLRELWYGIAGERILTPKREYAALRDPESGLLDRALAAARLFGLTRNQSGLLRSEPVFEWIVRNVDPSAPLLVPLVWAVTNLSQQQPEYFFVDPHRRSDEFRVRFTRALQMSLGSQTIVREATPDLLHRALFASAALPIAFDPVAMPGVEGATNAYCDGGVASNSPVGVAHSLSSTADVVLLDPPLEPEPSLEDAVAVAFSVFGTMQRKLLEVEMRTTYFQSVGRRAYERLTARELERMTQGDTLLSQYVENIPDTQLRYIRPEKTLPVDVIGFADAPGIDQTYRRGWLDAVNGFTPYQWETFVL